MSTSSTKKRTRKPNLPPVEVGERHGMLTAISRIPGSNKWLWLCDCGQYTEAQPSHVRRDVNPLSSCGCKRSTLNGLEKSREYQLWRTTYRDRWPEFTAFFAELGPKPDEFAHVGPIDLDKKVGPGNAVWSSGVTLASDFDATTYEGLQHMISQNKEIAAINKAAYEARKDPSTFEWMLDNIEKQSQPWEDKHEQQLHLEEESQRYAQGQWLRQQSDLEQKGRVSQADVGRQFLHKLVPIVALYMEETYNYKRRRLRGGNAVKHGSRYAHLLPRVITSIDDYHCMAYITIACAMDAVGRGATAKCPLVKLNLTIGERLEHQMFLNDLKEADDYTFKQAETRYLKDETRTYGRKIYAVKRTTEDRFNYEPLSEEERLHLGDWCMQCLTGATTWFESINLKPDPKSPRTVKYVSLSYEGLKHRDLIEAGAMASRYAIWPMVCPPIEWSEEQRGGYLKGHPGGSAILIHGNKGTELSEESYSAINRLASVPWRINRLIYEVMKELISKTNEIGAFKSYERDSWMDEHFPRIDPAVWDKPKTDPEHRKARRVLNEAHDKKALAEKQRVIPQRILETAARFVNFSEIYLPIFDDARGRMYYLCDTLSPQGPDYVKALLEFAEGTPVTEENFAQVEREYLINLANTWDGKADGFDRKTSKLSYDDRVKWAEEFTKDLQFIVDDPMSSEARKIWTSAGEPFLWLATLVEFWEVCRYKTKKTAHAPLALDATNSGSQILGGVLRDDKLCHFCNVVPSDDGLPQDMYGEVARFAQAKWSSFWRDAEYERINRNQEKKAKKINAERKRKGLPEDYVPKIDYSITLTPGDLTRSIAKRSTMCSAYGASHGSKWKYVLEELDEAGHKNVGYVEGLACTNAIIRGQAEAFPVLQLLDYFFITIGKLCLGKGQEFVIWRTPTGNLIKQEYREPKTKLIRTHAMGGMNAYQFERVNNVQTALDGESESDSKDDDESQKPGGGKYRLMVGYGDVIASKTSSALAANWTHSIDASVAVTAINAYDGPCGFIHDCLVAPPGKTFEFADAIHKAFHRCVSADVFGMLCEENGMTFDQVINEIPEDRRFEFGSVDIDECLKSPYLFS